MRKKRCVAPHAQNVSDMDSRRFSPGTRKLDWMTREPYESVVIFDLPTGRRIRSLAVGAYYDFFFVNGDVILLIGRDDSEIRLVRLLDGVAFKGAVRTQNDGDVPSPHTILFIGSDGTYEGDASGDILVREGNDIAPLRCLRSRSRPV